MLKTVLTSPKLEYVRLWIPQPIYLGLVAFLGTTVIVLAFHLLVNPATNTSNGIDIWAFPLTIPLFGSIGYTIVLYIFRLLAYLSGYRPFSTSLKFRNEGAMVQFEEQLKTRIQDNGFELFWENPHKGFIGVRGLEKDMGKPFFNEKAFPIRFVYLRKPRQNNITLTVKIEVRSILLWDTGEGNVIKELGNKLLRDAGANADQTPSLKEKSAEIRTIFFGSGNFRGVNPITALQNPDVLQLAQSMPNLTRIKIHLDTYDFRVLERFLTYAVNSVGQRHLKNHVEVDLYGTPEQLHPNLRNTLTNLCKRVNVHDVHELY